MRNGGKILILGGSGYLGRNLVARLGPNRAVATYHKARFSGGQRFDSLSMKVADILDSSDEISHAIILLGQTKIDSCAEDKVKSDDLNVKSIIRIIEELWKQNIVPVFTSTDSVFDGRCGNYDEGDETNPIVTYGKQKVSIERYLRSQRGEYCVVRLSKLYGCTPGDGTIFMNWLEEIKWTKPIRVANDQVFSPIFVDDAVDGLLNLIEIGGEGIFHLCGPESTTRDRFLDQMIEEIGIKPSSFPDIKRCSINEFDLREPRPLDVSMRNHKFVCATGLRPRRPRTVIRDFLLSHMIAGSRNQ